MGNRLTTAFLLGFVFFFLHLSTALADEKIVLKEELTGPVIQISFSKLYEVEKILDDENSLQGLRFVPCASSSMGKRKIQLGKFFLHWKFFDTQEVLKESYCEMVIRSSQKNEGVRVRRDRNRVDILWFEDDRLLQQYDAKKSIVELSRQYQEELNSRSGLGRQDLRLEIQNLWSIFALYPNTDYGTLQIKKGLQSESIHDRMAAAWAICRFHRADLFQEFKRSNIRALAKATPDQPWIDHCYRELLWGQNPNPKDVLSASRFAGFPGVIGKQSGSILRAELDRQIKGKPARAPSLDRIHLHFLLAIQAEAQRDFQEALKEIEAIQDSGQEFSFLFKINSSQTKKPTDYGQLFLLRVDPINLEFYRLEIIRDGLKDYRRAIQGYKMIHKKFPGATFLSMDGSESSYSTQADLWAKAQMIISRYKLGKKSACKDWVDLALDHSGERLTTYEGGETFCSYGFKMLWNYCEDQAFTLMKKKKRSFQKSTPACRQLFQGYQSTFNIN